jgi:hypothetical protein
MGRGQGSLEYLLLLPLVSDLHAMIPLSLFANSLNISRQIYKSLLNN